VKVPFTVREFFEVFGHYNTAIYPLQGVLILMAIAAVCFSVRPTVYSGRLVSLLLALLWLWTGVVYHIAFFSRVNPLAYLFGALFFVQAGVFLYAGVWKRQLNFRFSFDRYGIAGLIIIAYALLLYPLLGWLAGHVYPNSPTFGAPCPLTIFTFGILFWADDRVPAGVMIIPLLWAVIGTSAAFMFGVLGDLALIVAGVLSLALLWRRHVRNVMEYVD
jgi:hypothetical protein